MLEAWAAAEPGKPDEGLTVKQEIKAIDEAMTHSDENFLARHGGFGGAMQRLAAAGPGVTQSRRGGSDGFSEALPSAPDCWPPAGCVRCLGGTS